MPDGSRCRAGPQRERPYCFAHDPERAAEAAEARKLGGLRRRKEGTIALAYDLPGLDTVAAYGAFSRSSRPTAWPWTTASPVCAP